MREAVYTFENLHTMDTGTDVTQDLLEMSLIFDPVFQWVKDELETGKGSYLGYYNRDNTAKGRVELVRRSTLYPTYIQWSRRRNIHVLQSHHQFGDSLIAALHQTDYGKNSKRIKIVENVQKSTVSSKENTEQVNNTNVLVESPSNNCKTLYENLYEKYYACLGKSKLKDFLNSFIRTILKNNDYKREIVDKCVKEYEKESKVGSPEFKSLTLKVISASVDKIANYGYVPYTYYSMEM